MNIVKQAWEKFQGVCTLIADVLEKKVDYLTFAEQLKKALDDLGGQIIREVLEATDTYLREHKEERPGWRVERKDDPKTILTPFGQVAYRRTSCRHKETGSCAYLVDNLAGYGPHQKVDVLVKAEAVERATELSCGKSGKISPAAVVSAETALKALREFTPRDTSPPPKIRRKCRYLVEADEDHVSGQDKKGNHPGLRSRRKRKGRPKKKKTKNPATLPSSIISTPATKV